MYFQLTINQNGFSKKCKSRFFQKTKIPANPKTKISPKHVSSNFQPLCCCSVMLKEEKKRKVPCTDTSKELKNLIWVHFQSHLSQNLFSHENKFFPSKSLWYCNFKQKIKIKKFHTLTFDNSLIKLLWAHFGSLLTQKPQNKIFLT